MILLIIASWIGLSLAEKRAERHNINKDDLNNVIFYGLIAFIIGGRISFVLQNLPTFFKSPTGIVSINPDLFDAFGGLAAAIIAALIFGQRRGLALWPILDALTPFFAILSIGLGLAHLAAGTAFGKETDLAWGIDLWSATRHPTQIYEALASLLIFGLIWFKKHDPHPGILFLTFAALTASAQIILQAFRGDSTLILNGLRQEQIIAWIALAICFLLFETRFNQNTNG